MSQGRGQPERFGTRPPPLQWDGVGLGTDPPAAKPGAWSALASPHLLWVCVLCTLGGAGDLRWLHRGSLDCGLWLVLGGKAMETSLTSVLLSQEAVTLHRVCLMCRNCCSSARSPSHTADGSWAVCTVVLRGEVATPGPGALAVRCPHTTW